jgi:hypothetical protein
MFIIAGFCVLCRWNYITAAEEGSLGWIIFLACCFSLIVAFCNREPKAKTLRMETHVEEYVGKAEQAYKKVYRDNYYR